MNDLFNKKVLYLIPLIFLIVIMMRIVYSYNEAQERKYDFAYKEAEVLNTYAMAHRTYYQQFFLKKIIPLTPETLPALPAASSAPISKNFSQSNRFNISIQTVSDRARNPKNKADIDELQAIDFFKKNPDEDTYFSGENNEVYQFAYALRIEQKCLVCHGKKEAAPLFIQNSYDNAYNYKLGELRGIQSIKIPADVLNSYFMKDFIYSIIYDLVIFLALFIGSFILAKKSKNINEYLQKEIDIKTQKLRRSLTIDTLTNLPNRLQLLDEIEKTKGSKSRHLALINVDRFKDINDFYGHDIGDIVLQSISPNIQKLCTHEKSFLYKLPSDEFGIFTTRDLSEYEFKELIVNILHLLHSTKVTAADNSIVISLSAGIASNTSSVLSQADIALKIAKDDAKEIIVYNQDIDTTEDILKNMKGILLIKDAIDADTIIPYYQAIYNMKTKQIDKYEALVRIIKDDGTVLSPFSFLDIAIKSKLYPHITKAMITKSFDFFQDKTYEFSVNLSIDDILNPSTTEFIIEKIKTFPEPQRIVFEILESDEIQDYEKLKEFIFTIKEYGCKFALDDFGSGYSNFAHVLTLNIDFLKIDSSLVKDITTNENSKAITQTIIHFASTLGLETIAEYVEDKESFEMLEGLGVDYIQGYYIGKPQEDLITSSK